MISFFKRKKTEGIIFLHLPKAGGTTLRHIFYNQYNYLKEGELYTVNRTKETFKFLELSEKAKAKIKVLIGHFPFGLHNHLSGEFKYVTFMRDPIDRAISAYFYNKGNKTSDVYEIIKMNNLSLEQYLDANVEPWSNNAMTKHFAGCTLDQFKQECTQEMFEKAKDNLKNHCIAVGLTERFDESLEILKSKLNWSKVKYESKNVTPKKKEKVDIDENVLNKIKTINNYDIEFYKLGKDIFENDIKELS